MTETILIVDDSEDDQRLYRRVFKHLDGYQCKTALTAADGLAIARTDTPSLILLDYRLPDMDGLEFINKLAENAINDVPVIMLTGEGSEPVAVEAMKNGANDYLVKDTAGGFLRLLPSVIKHVMKSHTEKLQTRRLRILHQTILHTVADGVIGIDSSGNIVFVNQSAERMLRSTQPNLIGRDVTELLFPEGTQSDWDSHPLSSIHNNAESLCRDVDIIQRDDGDSFPVSYTASRLHINDSGALGWVMVFQDITSRKNAERELIRTAHYDTLTGLANRVMFDDCLAKAIARSDRGQRQLALFFIDLDGFKEVNDNLGHHAGDQLLQLVSKRLAESVRTGDVVCRLGGDEFTLIIEDSQPDYLESLAKKVLAAVEMSYLLLGNHEIKISASIGIASYPKSANDADGLIEKADAAMYCVKKSGKNGYCFS